MTYGNIAEEYEKEPNLRGMWILHVLKRIELHLERNLEVFLYDHEDAGNTLRYSVKFRYG